MSAHQGAAPRSLTRLEIFSHEARDPWALDDDREPIDVAEEFHLASRVYRDVSAQAMGPSGRQFAVEPELAFALGRKCLTSGGPRIPLPAPPALPIDLAEVVLRRRSSQPSHPGPMSFEDLATVLALSSGPSPGSPNLRVTPSGGAMYPIDTVVIAHDVTSLNRGAYVYDGVTHSLLPRGEVEPAAFHHDAVATLYMPPQVPPPTPSITLAYVATFARTRVKYGLRGYRFALMETGHLAQAAITVAGALELETLPLGGFVDSAADAALDLDGVQRSCLYLLAVSAQRADDGADASGPRP